MEVTRDRAVFGVALGLLLAGAAHAEAPGASRFVVSRWGVADGLPQTSVTAIAQDDRGFIWVTTFGGLARFDGRSFVRIDPAHGDLDGHRFLSVACTGSTIWVGTDHGRLFRFDDYGEREPVEVKLKSSSIEPLWQLLVDGPRLLIAAGAGGVHELDVKSGKTSRLDVTPVIAQAIALDAERRLWTAGDHQLRRVNGPEAFEVREPSAVWAIGNTVGVAGRDGRFEVRDGALHRVGAGGRVLEDVRHAQTWSIGPDALSLTTVLSENRIALPSPRATMPSVRGLLLDATDCLWVATDEAGLYRVRDRHVTTVAEGAGLVGGSALLVHPLGDGTALISTYCHGLQRLEVGLPRRVTRVDGAGEDECVNAMAAGEDGVWVGLGNGLGWFDGTRVEAVPSGLDPKLPGDLRAVVVKGKVLWVGSSDGLTKLEGDRHGLKLVRRWTAADGLPHDSVFSLALDGDEVLVGTLRGLVRLTAEGKPRPAIRAEDARPAVVRDLLVEPDAIWAATYGEGLARIERSGATTWLSRDQGFCSDELSRLLRVGDDVWLNGNQGAFRLSMAELRRAAVEHQPVSCRFSESGEGNGGGQPAGAQVGSMLAFPTVEGVVLIDPEEFRATSTVSPLFLQRARVDETVLEQRRSVLVPPGRRDFAVQLMTPPGGDDLREPNDITTLLIRDGIERSERVGGLSATYIGLPPGDYVFRAQRQGGAPLELAFTLQRSFTETRLARVGIPFLILALIGLVLRSYLENVRSRTRALEAQLDERMQAERARKERDELYATVFDVSPGPLFVFLTDGTLREANPAARKLLAGGTLQLPVQGLPFLDAADRAAFLQLLAAAAQQPAHAETTLSSEARGRRRLSVDAGPLHFGGEVQVLVAATDVTSARQAEQQRAELLERNANSQRLEGLGRLAAGVAHDFNNVLAALQLQLEDLKLTRGDPKSVETLTEMEEAVRTGRDLTSRFLVFGKGDTQPSVFVLDEAVEESKRLLTRLMKGDVRFEVSCSAAGARVKMPRVHLDRVLLNLVLNARDALEGGSSPRVTVRTSSVPQCPPADATERQVLPAPEGKCVVLEVEDGGCGMSAETLARAFEPFFTTRAATQGTGLGLTVVHNIALRLGAGLTVTSRQGTQSGTRFRLQLPQVSSPSQELPRQQVPTGAKFRVLVADDTALLRKSLVRQFKSDGWDVLEAADGKQALERCSVEALDLLITDLVMPELDGVELILRLRERGSKLPIILLSGYTGDATARLDFVKAGVQAMDKPFVPEELLALARRLVGASPTPARP